MEELLRYFLGCIGSNDYEITAEKKGHLFTRFVVYVYFKAFNTSTCSFILYDYDIKIIEHLNDEHPTEGVSNLLTKIYQALAQNNENY